MDAHLNENQTARKSITPPAGATTKMYLNHLGLILSNLSMVLLVLSILSFSSWMVPALYYVFLILLTLISIGTVFGIIPNFASWWGAGANILPVVSMIMTQLLPWLLGLTMLSATASLILLLIDKYNRNYTRIAFSIIMLVLTAVVVVLLLMGAVK